MAMVWNTRNDGLNSSGGNGSNRFQEHNERMRLFRKSHDFQEHNQRMRAFRLSHPNNQRQWGRRVPEVPEGLPALVPTVLLPGVLLETYSPN